MCFAVKLHALTSYMLYMKLWYIHARGQRVVVHEPESGWVFDIMRCTRSKYHYIVRNLKRTRGTQIRAALGRALLLDGNLDYSRGLKKIRGKIRSVTSVIDGFTESKDIANTFASKYSGLTTV